MLFHHYGGPWTSFLNDIDVEAVQSGSTTGDIVVTGASLAENETCLPVKVFTGHLTALKDSCDLVLVPRVKSQYPGMKSCPKYLGLPDMAKCLVRGLPPVVSPAMDLGDRRGVWAGEWRELAVRLGATPSQAGNAARRMEKRLRLGLKQKAPAPGDGLVVGVAGHLYNIHDPQASLGLIDKINRMGVQPVTVEQVPERLVRGQLKTVSRKVRWDFESRVVGSVLYWSRSVSVAGIIYVNSFACGPGSMIGALIEDELGREKSVPLMTITLDEHSAEGGLITRIEAFLDLLRHAAPDRNRSGVR